MSSKEKQTGSAAEWTPIGKLKPWALNPRKNDGAPVDKVAESIKRFGFASPIIVRRETNEIIAGHTRWKAAKKLGLKTVPVRYMDVSESDAKLLAIADNRLAEEADWDNEALAAIILDLKENALDISVMGFNDDELNFLMTEKGINDPNAEWVGMPEYVSNDETAYRDIIIHFKCEADVKAFAKLLKQSVTDKTRMLWYPQIEIDHVAGSAYVNES